MPTQGSITQRHILRLSVSTPFPPLHELSSYRGGHGVQRDRRIACNIYGWYCRWKAQLSPHSVDYPQIKNVSYSEFGFWILAASHSDDQGLRPEVIAELDSSNNGPQERSFLGCPCLVRYNYNVALTQIIQPPEYSFTNERLILMRGIKFGIMDWR